MVPPLTVHRVNMESKLQFQTQDSLIGNIYIIWTFNQRISFISRFFVLKSYVYAILFIYFQYMLFDSH